ncbi:dorsal-ventral patterning tolloid-like protein 1 [Tachypleus tridentatus]|uniref:dorsal-ventral patterning tolloid-like protein 1 n=1 Tax=Tachypleus tridentatus TaxID=6853 RepID=UPI003FD10982
MDCFHRIPVQNQILKSDDLRSRSDNCSEIKIFVDGYPSTRNYLKLLYLNALKTKNWLFLTADNEKSPGYAINAIKRQEKEPFIAIGQFFLLTVHKCEACQFKAVFSSLNQVHGCNITIDAVQGILTSPNFPEKYPPSLDCYYNIEATVGLKLVVSVMNLDIHSRNTEGICNENYVRVFPLKEQKEVFLCENSVDSREHLVSKSEALTVHLHSSNVSRGKGFLFKYRSIKPCENITVEQENGSLCSEDYPYSFMTDQSCLYVFYVPFGYKLHLQLTFLETSLSSVTSGSDCVEEFIEISSEEQTVRLCGITSNNTNQDFFFQSNSYTNITVKLKAVPKLDNEARGFCIDFQTVPIIPLGTLCGYPWSENKDYCYQLVQQNLNWWSANAHCLSQGGHLATVSSNNIQSFLESLIKTSSLHGHTHAFWIGANDIEHENYYVWADGNLFGFSNWFPGWTNYNYYNSQPSDDGLSNQDCVEMRDRYRYPTKGEGETEHFYWNDRDCSVQNLFICQRPKQEVHIETSERTDCNRTIFLQTSHPRDVITSPGYPEPYTKLVECYYNIRAPSGEKINLDFTDFLLEEHESCTFDYLELRDGDNTAKVKKYCGDYASKLKHLRHLSTTNEIKLKFVSDFSRAYRVSERRFTFGMTTCLRQNNVIAKYFTFSTLNATL